MAEAVPFDKQDFIPRDYQIEIFEEACQKNVIACLGTGTGKTFISVMLIKELANEINGNLKDGGKRTFFLVTTVPLVYQQSKAIEERTMLKIGKYTGDMGVDFWSKEDWKKEFDSHDVLVMTHQILLNMLLHDYIKPSNINLLVLDECHHTDKNHPYAIIMERIEDSQKRPRVLGLTASIINEKTKHRGIQLRQHLEQRMKALEIKLRAVCLTCADQSSTLPFATKPEESIEEYDTVFPSDDDEIAKMYDEFCELLAFDGDKPTDREGKAAFKKCADSLKDLTEILKSLGVWCTYKAALTVKENIRKEIESWFHDDSEKWLKHVVRVTERIISIFEEFVGKTFGCLQNILIIEPMVTPKVFKLMDLLVTNKEGLCAIIFVQRRITAQVLSDLINNFVTMYEHYDGIVSDFVYGHNLMDWMNGNEYLSMTSKNQEKILRRFRSAEFNVLVATSVVEEGLDVPKCNVVIRFDGVNNYREYVQSKGRARAQNSKFIVLSEQSMLSETSYFIEGLEEVEQILIEKSRGRDLPTEKEIAEYKSGAKLIEPFKVSNEEGAAEIGIHNAMQLLYMYCSKLPSDQYATLKPIFTIEELKEYGEFKAIVRMPMNCPLREDIEGDWLPLKDLAKISAAQKACIRLWEIGHLDDHFVPIKLDSDSEEEDDEDDDDDIPSNRPAYVYNRKIPTCLSVNKPFPQSGLYLYGLEMVLAKPRTGQRECALGKAWNEKNRHMFGLVTVNPLPKLPVFPLYTRAGEIHVEINLLQENVSFGAEEFQTAEKFHGFVMRSFAKDFVEGRHFSFSNANSKALLVSCRSEFHSGLKYSHKKKMRFDSFIDYAFMEEVSSNQFIPIDNYLEDAVIKKTYLDDSNTLYYVTKVTHEIKITDKIANGKPTYKEYYRSKYGKEIKSKQPLLESVRADTRLNHTSPRFSDDIPASSTNANLEHLVPELCVKLKMPASFHCQSVCIPSLLLRLETILLAEELRCQILYDISISATLAIGALSDTINKDECFDGIMRKPKKLKSDKYQSCLVKVLMKQGAVGKMKLDQVCANLKAILRGNNSERNDPIRVELILQSLTTVKAKAGFDLERLETLGDSFLKVATSVFLFYEYPKKHEGQLTEKRKRLISNEKLLKEAKKRKVPEMICNTAFGIKQTAKEEDVVYDYTKSFWVPPMFKMDSDALPVSAGQEGAPCQVIRDKSIADCIEALIGAFFVHDGVTGALTLMKWAGIDCSYAALKDENKSDQGKSAYADFALPKSAVFENTEANLRHITELHRKMRLNKIENKMGYSFKDKSFLVQALTHMSFYKNRVTDCYQRLEFLGDAVLDFLIIAHLYANNTELDPSSLTNIKSALVNNNTFALLTLKYGFHKGILRLESKLDSALSQFGDLDDDKIACLLENPFIIRLGETDEGFDAPKILGDIFESLAGAVFLDSGLDLIQVWRVFYPMIQPLIDAYVENVPLNPVRKLHELDANASCSSEKMENGKVKCTWKVGKKTFAGMGQNLKMAKAAAAQKALKDLLE